MINFEKADKFLTSIGIYPTNIIAKSFDAGAVPRYSLEAEIDTLKFIKKLSDFNERKERDNMPSYYGELLTNRIYNLGFLKQEKEEDKLPKKYIEEIPIFKIFIINKLFISFNKVLSIEIFIEIFFELYRS